MNAYEQKSKREHDKKKNLCLFQETHERKTKGNKELGEQMKNRLGCERIREYEGLMAVVIADERTGV